MRRVGGFFGSLLVLVLLVGSVAACGDSDIGESCDDEGKVKGDCVTGAVCGHQKSTTDGDLVCLKQCNSLADCGMGETCGGVGGTNLQGCRGK